MIYSVIVKDPAKTPIAWWPKVLYLQRDRFDFGRGVNLLFGPNGSGKSTLLLALARTFCCAQGGVPRMTCDSIHDLTMGQPFDTDVIERLRGLDVRHDGRVVGHFDPDHEVGLVGGAFDYEFFHEGVRNVTAKGSSGETQMRRMTRILRQEPSFTDRIGDHVNDLWLDWRRQVLDVQRANEPEGPPTVLLDEPERSLDIPRRAVLWRKLFRAAEERQIIVATHDPLALLAARDAGEGVRVMETAPDYVEACWRVLDAFFQERE